MLSLLYEVARYFHPTILKKSTKKSSMNFPFAPTPTKLFSLALIGATRRNTEAIRARAHKKPRIETEQKKANNYSRARPNASV